MKALFGEVSNNIMTVSTIHNTPELLSENDLANAILVDSIPDIPVKAGFAYSLMANILTKELTYAEFEVPKTPDQIREERISSLELAIASVLGM